MLLHLNSQPAKGAEKCGPKGLRNASFLAVKPTTPIYALLWVTNFAGRAKPLRNYSFFAVAPTTPIYPPIWVHKDSLLHQHTCLVVEFRYNGNTKNRAIHPKELCGINRIHSLLYCSKTVPAPGMGQTKTSACLATFVPIQLYCSYEYTWYRNNSQQRNDLRRRKNHSTRKMSPAAAKTMTKT